MSIGIGTGMGAIAGFVFSTGGYVLPIVGGVVGGMGGLSLGLFVVV